MYNDKNPLYSSNSRRDIPPRTLVGRSCPTFAKAEAEVSELPRVDERQGRRLCDGTLREDAYDNGAQGRHVTRNENANSMNGCNNMSGSGCGNGNGGWGLKSYPLAMVYSPLQEFREVYEPDVALERGTMFAELDLPFEGGKSGKGGCR